MQLSNANVLRRSPFLRAGLGGLIALGYLAGLIVAGSELLHHCLHDDAHSPGHFCAASILNAGDADGALGLVTVVVPDPPTHYLLPVDRSCPAAPDFLHLPGRAPPSQV
ncbi:MAG: hypothetical protein ACYC23_04460 [Limisphaerales bacterium]